MQSKHHLWNALKFLLFVGLGCGLLYLLYRSQNESYLNYCQEEGIPAEDCNLLDKIWNDFRTANYFWIGMAVICYFISCVSRAARWLMLLQPLGYRPSFWNAFMTLMLGYFANLGLPRVGEVVRPATLARYENVPFENAIGTIVVERAIDVLMLALMMALGFLLQFDVLWGYLSENADIDGLLQRLLGNGLLWIAAILGLGLAIAAYIYRAQLLQHALAQKILNFLKGLWEGVLSIRQLDNPLGFIAHTLTIWFMYYLMTYLAFFAFAPTAGLSPVVGLMIFLFGALGIVVPTPGGMGAYQTLVTAALTIYGVDSNDGFSFSNMLFFAIQIGANVLLGVIALLVLPIYNREK